MRVIVTGSTGYIGRHVIEELLKYPAIEIIAITTNRSKVKNLPISDRIQFLQVDLSKPTSLEILDCSNCDALIHLAWSGLPEYKNSYHLSHNLDWNKHFLTHVLKQGLGNICVTGTCLEYGKISGELKETMDCSPDIPYSIAKYKLYEHLITLQTEYDFSLKWLRLFYTFGDGQSEKSLIHQLKKAIENKERTFPMSGGLQVRDFLEVKEVARNIVHCTLQNEVTGIINCCSGNPVQIKTFVQRWLEDHGHVITLDLGVYPYPDYEPMAFWGNTNKLSKALNCQVHINTQGK